MGIRIDVAADLINATDGSLTIEGQSVNTTGIITASGGMKVGSAATIHSTGQFNIGVAATIFANGNATYSGIVSATTFASSGGIDVSGGLGIAESLFHLDDINTRVAFPANDTVSVETAGAEDMRVASGIVAIGTETTSGIGAKLRVAVPFLTQQQDLSDGGMIFVPTTGDQVAANQVMPGMIWSGQGSNAGIARAGIAAVSTHGRTAMDLVFMTRYAADGTALKMELNGT